MPGGGGWWEGVPLPLAFACYATKNVGLFDEMPRGLPLLSRLQDGQG